MKGSEAWWLEATAIIERDGLDWGTVGIPIFVILQVVALFMFYSFFLRSRTIKFSKENSTMLLINIIWVDSIKRKSQNVFSYYEKQEGLYKK